VNIGLDPFDYIFLKEHLARFGPLAGSHPGNDRDLPHLAERRGRPVLRQVARRAQEVLQIGAAGGWPGDSASCLASPCRFYEFSVAFQSGPAYHESVLFSAFAACKDCHDLREKNLDLVIFCIYKFGI
jgi:hypothetical protein